MEFTSKDIIAKMEERGFVPYSYERSNNALVGIQFLTSFNNPKPTLNVFVNLTEAKFGYFKIGYQIPNSFNSITTPECGSVMNDSHFDSILSKIKQQATVFEPNTLNCEVEHVR